MLAGRSSLVVLPRRALLQPAPFAARNLHHAGLRPAGGPSRAVVSQRSVCSAATDFPAVGTKEVVLYQYAICPFCNQVKAVCDFYGIDYRSVEVNPLSKKEIKDSTHRKVPIAFVNGEQINETKDIIATLSTLAAARGQSAMPDERSEKWQTWASESLARNLYPNVSNTLENSYKAFSYADNVPSWSSFDRFSVKAAGAVAMWAANGKIKQKYNITDERAAVLASVNEFIAEVGDDKFLGGDAPSLADACVYGCLRGVEGLPAHDEIMANSAIKPWYERMRESLGPSRQTKYE